MSKTKRRIFYIVDSIKGGCGKTTFSIMLARYLNDKKPNEIACIFDMDFMGSGLLNLFHTDGEVKEFHKDYMFINEQIRDFRGDRSKRYIQQIKIGNRQFYIAFSDPSFETKKEFLVAAKNNYSMAIKYQTMAAGLRKMLSPESLDGQYKNIQHVIIDMSPSDDNYSEVIKEMFWNRRKESVRQDKDKLNYFLMLGGDRSHLSASISYIQHLFNDDIQIPDNIFIVFNEMFTEMSEAHCKIETGELSEEEITTRIKNETKVARDKRFEEFKTHLRLNEEQQAKIHFLAFNPFGAYMSHVQNMKPLTEIYDDTILDPMPFSHYASFNDSEMNPVNSADLEKQVLQALVFEADLLLLTESEMSEEASKRLHTI